MVPYCSSVKNMHVRNGNRKRHLCSAQALEFSLSHESHGVAEEKRMIARIKKIEVRVHPPADSTPYHSLS